MERAREVLPEPQISVVEGDIAEVSTDVIALKYAQAFFGADYQVASLLARAGEDVDHLKPSSGGHRLLPCRGAVKAEKVLFVGVPPLPQFGYRQIREFARHVLATLAAEAPDIHSIATTVHGPGYGLDEIEAFEAEVAGFLDAIRSRDIPKELDRVLVVERNPGRCHRLKQALTELLPRSGHKAVAVADFTEATEQRLRTAGYDSATKSHIFVAMPFNKEMDDLYRYGIQGPVRSAGFLCERADLASFTGDVLDWVRKRIKTCSLLVAELSEPNPNVYLEVGYAWGTGVPTVLLAKDCGQLPFNVRGQRCLEYSNITNLERALTKELVRLRDGGATS